MPKIERHDECAASDHGPLRIRCEQKARCSSDDGGGRSECGRIVGQVASQAGQLLVSTRGLGKAGALAELLERQPALADRVTQQRDAALALGIGGEDRRRLALDGLAHLPHRTAPACGACAHGAVSISRVA